MRSRLSAIGLWVLIVAAAPGAWADEHAGEIVGFVPVQLRSFSVPTDSGEGWIGRGPISMFLVVRGQRNVGVLCRYLPRIREAITLLVDRSPIPVTGSRFHLEGIGVRLHGAINRVLPKPLVVRLHLVPGARKLGQDAVDLDLPEANPECMAIRELPADVQAMLNRKNSSARTFITSDRDTLAPDAPVSNPPATAAPVRKAPDRSAPAPSGPAITVKRLEGVGVGSSPTCVDIQTLWAPSFHYVGGNRYWLGRVFTLDDNNDGGVDNVGFVLEAGKTPDLHIYYFPGQGRQSVITAPTLRLSDDRLVPNLCHGQTVFDAPPGGDPAAPAETSESTGGPDEKPDSALDSQGNDRGLMSGPGLFFAIAIGAGAILIGGGIVGYVLAKRRADRRRRDRRGRSERRGADRRREAKPRDGAERRTVDDRREADDRRQATDRRGETPAAASDAAPGAAPGGDADGEKGD